MPYGIPSGGGAVPLPTVTFDDKYTVEVGGQVLELEYRGANHEPGNIFIYAPMQKTLLLIDIIFPGWTPFKNLALAEDIPGYFRAHDVACLDSGCVYGGSLSALRLEDDLRPPLDAVR